MLYADPNIPCGQATSARWEYGQANPSGDAQHKIWGWTARNVAPAASTPTGPTGSTGASGSSGPSGTSRAAGTVRVC